MSKKSSKSYLKYVYTKRCVICGLRKTDNVILHKVPKNEILRDKWNKAMKKELGSSNVICSNHFKTSDYRNCQVKKILVSGAVPTVELDGRNISETENQTFSKSSQRLSKYETFNLSDKQNVDSDSEDDSMNLSSSQTNENTNSEEEICYIYYLDDKQNVRFYESSARHANVASICSDSSDSNQIVNPSNFEGSQENSPWNMEYDATQSISDYYREDQSFSHSLMGQINNF